MTIVRNFFIFLFLIWFSTAIGQTDTSALNWSDNYDAELAEIASLEQQGQNRSAYLKAEKLFDQKVHEKNIPGMVGSLNLLIRNIYRVDDEALLKVLKKMGSTQSDHPVVSAVVNSYLAELLTQYYERNRYQISQITAQESLSWDDVNRWAAPQIEHAIDSLYHKSVKPESLKEISSEKVKPLLDHKNKEIHFELRPRLYDLLQERLLTYLQNNRLNWHAQLSQYDESMVDQLTKEDLSDYLKAPQKDTRLYLIIKAYNQWEQSLKMTNHTEGYIDVLLQRIKYVGTNLDKKYIPASGSLLQALIDKYPSVRNRAEISFTRAHFQYTQGDYVAALRTLETALDQKADDAYKNNIDQIHSLIKTIKTPSTFIETEETYPDGQRPLLMIHYRNLDQVRLELYPLDLDEYVKWRFTTVRREMSDFNLTRLKTPIWKKTVELPDVSDYKEHRTETLLNRNLKKGAYALRYWHRRDGLDISGMVLFQVSDLTLVGSTQEHNRQLHVLHRQTGKNIQGARVESITVDRRNQFRNSEIRILREQGSGIFVPDDKAMNQYYKVTHGDDCYISPLTYQNHSYHSAYQPFRRTVLKTDRAVYKPGQTIHFKALTVLARKLDAELLKDQPIDISLRNANGKEVWQKTYRTDEWGTVTGSVPIPVSGLKGSWSLQASPAGHARIQVEDYQRPNFEVTVPDSSVYRPDSNHVALPGKALTYHGFPVQNGQGEFRVELQRHHWFYSIRPSHTEELMSGSFRTNEEGAFEITFEGVDPPEEKYRYGAFYFYAIHVSVQAPSGEIRAVMKTLPLDPDQVQVQLNYPTFQVLEDMAPLRFSVKNAWQKPDSEQVEMRISRLEAPENYKVNRAWSMPDQPILTPKDFQKHVDHLFYDHSANMEDWGVRNSIKEWSQHLEDGDSLDLVPLIKQPGYYRVIAVSAKGDTLSTASFGIGSLKKRFAMVHDAVEVVASSESAQPGETVRLNLFTPPETRGGRIVISRSDGSSDTYNLSDQKYIEVKIKEKDRGGIHVRFFGYLANRFYEKSLLIEVPWKNKTLDIGGLDDLVKLEVNTDTALNISIKDYLGEGVESEVAIAIYDASLDAYVPHDWSMQQRFFRDFSNPLTIHRIAGTHGDRIISRNNYFDHRISIHPLIIPHLPGLNFGYGGLQYMRRNLKVTGMVSAPAMESSDVAVEEFSMDAGSSVEKEQDLAGPEDNAVHVRKDFSETILFRGKLKTDSSGQIRIPFHTNDKAGRWKIVVFAHTPDLSSGVASHTFETFKDLMLESYLPGMVRQGDQMNLNFTLYNNANKAISGKIQFEMHALFDNDKSVYQKNLGFDLNAGASSVLSMPVSIASDEVGPLIFKTRVVDDAGNVWDATEEVVPVYPASETIYDGDVIVLKEGESWSGEEIAPMLDNGQGDVTIRIVHNMYSELLKSIPYLQSSNPVTTDQFFRNGIQALLGQYLTDKIPDFEMIYQEWKRKGELESRLAQNEDKKYVNLENTPWVRQSDSGTEQMALLGLFFDDSHMNQVIEENIAKWLQSQNSDGGFPWIKDGPSSFFMTIRFLSQWNKLKWAGLAPEYFSGEDQRRAQAYVDSEFLRQWKKMKNDSSDSTVHFQRFISYFKERALGFAAQDDRDGYMEAWSELKDSVYANWPDYSPGFRADIGIAAWHLGDKNVSQKITAATVDNAAHDQKLGTYWRYNNRSYQSGYLGDLAKITELLILNDNSSLNPGITQWVLVNKMTNDWQQNPDVLPLMLSLLKMDGKWTTTSKSTIIKDGKETALKGIGDAGEIVLDANTLATFRIDHREGPPIWLGMITRKEVQPEDQLKQRGDILKIEKWIAGIKSTDTLQVGDQVTVRLTVKADRDLDYVYINDPLVPGMDPGISLSGFQWKLGLSYYQSFDAGSAQFYIQHLPKGEYILEYKLGVVRSGVFRHPHTKIQSYFVPEINGFDQWKPVIKVDSR